MSSVKKVISRLTEQIGIQEAKDPFESKVRKEVRDFLDNLIKAGILGPKDFYGSTWMPILKLVKAVFNFSPGEYENAYKYAFRQCFVKFPDIMKRFSWSGTDVKLDFPEILSGLSGFDDWYDKLKQKYNL